MNFQIKNPCNENWNEMTVIDAGRFCDACKSNVHDFSNASAEVIAEQYELNKGRICGRISNNLLREQFKNAEVRKGYFYHLKIFCWAALLGFGASLFSIPAANATGMIKQLRSHILNVERQQGETSAEVKVKGTAKDKKTAEPLPFVSVELMVNDSAVMITTTDIDGNYEFTIDPGKYPVFDLKFMYVFYESMLIKNIRPEGKNAFADAEMKISEQQISLGIIVSTPSPPLINWFQSGKTVGGDEYKRMPKQ